MSFRRSESVVEAKTQGVGLVNRARIARLFTPLSGMTSGAVWTAIAAIFARGAPLLYSIVIARSLGKEVAGQFSIVQSTAMLVVGLTGPGLHTVATKELAGRDAGGGGQSLVVSAIRAAWLMGLVGSAALVLAADWIAANVLGGSTLAAAIRLGGSLVVLFGTLVAVGNGVLLGLHRFRPIAEANFVSGTVGLVAVSLGAIAAGVTGAVIGLGGAYAANYFMLRRGFGVRTQGRPARDAIVGTRRWIQMSLPLSVSYGIYGVANWLAIAALGRSAHGYGAVAVFYVGNQWQTAILFLPTALSVVLLPRLSRLLSLEDSAGFHHTFGVTLLTNIGLGIAGVLVVVICAQPLLTLYGPEFRDGEATLRVMALGSIPVIVSNLTSQVLYARGMLRAAMWIQVPYTLALMALAVWLIPAHGALGLALANAGAHCVLAIANGTVIAIERNFR
jgi:O-antigen/teichoic acid export membrane protein